MGFPIQVFEWGFPLKSPSFRVASIPESRHIFCLQFYFISQSWHNTVQVCLDCRRAQECLRAQDVQQLKYMQLLQSCDEAVMFLKLRRSCDEAVTFLKLGTAAEHLALSAWLFY